MQLLDRLKRLEALKTPLERARALLIRGVHPRELSTLELEVFSQAENADLHDLTDQELERLASSKSPL